MLLTSLTCPVCKSVLKSKDGVPAGTRIVCPKCRKPFVASAPARPKKPADSGDDERPPPKRKPPAPIATRRAATEDTDDDEPSPKKRKKKKKKKPRVPLELILGASVAGVILIATVIVIAVVGIKTPPDAARPNAARPPGGAATDDANATHESIVKSWIENMRRTTAALANIGDEKSALAACETVEQEANVLSQSVKSLTALGPPSTEKLNRVKVMSQEIQDASSAVGGAINRASGKNASVPPNVATRLKLVTKQYNEANYDFATVAVKYGF